METKDAQNAGGLFCFRWWYKGRTVEGNTIKLEGRVAARDASSASAKVEKQMRSDHPTIKWMQGKNIEGNGIAYGPTVQKTKLRVEAAKE